MTAKSTEQDRIAEHKSRWNETSFMRAQGLAVEEVATGRVIVRLPRAHDSQRGGGNAAGTALNGGVIAYMFDAALGWAIISSLLALPGARDFDPDDLAQFTLNLDITYLDAALGERFEAHGSTVRASKSTAFAEGRLLDAHGRLCATAKGIWRVFWPRAGTSRADR